MTAEVHAFARPGAAGRSPLVPAKAVLDGAKLLTDPEWLESRWFRSCTPTQALAGLALRIRSIKQEPAGSFDDDDVELAYLADFGRDVHGWLAAKAKVLEGWILCSDNRWHHPDIARNVLHIWLGRLDARRVSAWANFSKAKEGGDYGLDSILDDIDEALAALRALDPQDVVLRKSTKVAADWRKRVTEALTPYGDTATVIEIAATAPNRSPNGQPNGTPPGGDLKRSEAKQSLESSFPQRGNDSSDPDNDDGVEVEGPGGSVKRTPGRPDKAPPWPSGWFEAFKARYPRKEAWGRAEKVLERIRKAGRLPFDEILAGVDRLAAEGRVAQYTPMASTWLNDRGWENETGPMLPVPARASPSMGGPRRNPHFEFAESLLEHEP